MTLDRVELLQLGIRLCDLSRGCGVAYQKIWRATAGEPLRDAVEAERVSAFIETARERSKGVATA